MSRIQPAARAVLVLFGLAALLIVNGALCLLTDFWFGGAVTGWILAGVGVVLLASSLASFVSIARWNAKRKAGWSTLPVRVLVDHARGEKDKTLVDTADGKWRIALLNYPLPLRDRIEAEGQVEYLGELEHKKPILVRPVGVDLEFLGYARSSESLRNRR